MANKEPERLWQERVAQWQAGGMSQRAYAMAHGVPVACGLEQGSEYEISHQPDQTRSCGGGLRRAQKL